MALDRRTFIKGTIAGLTIATIGLSPLELMANAGGQRVHIVQRGDTLSGIAARYGTTVRGLQQANNLSSDLIRIGQRLVIPGGIAYTAEVRQVTAALSVSPTRWEHVVVHHSAIERGNATIYDRNHRRRGMENGLAYHFVIGNGIDSPDGAIEIGDRWRRQILGGHVRSHAVNLTGIGICLVGNFEERRPSVRQMAALTELMDYLTTDVMRGRYKFGGHKDIDGPRHTVCPGRHFPLREMHQRYRGIA